MSDLPSQIPSTWNHYLTSVDGPSLVPSFRSLENPIDLVYPADALPPYYVIEIETLPVIGHIIPEGIDAYTGRFLLKRFTSGYAFGSTGNDNAEFTSYEAGFPLIYNSIIEAPTKPTIAVSSHGLPMPFLRQITSKPNAIYPRWEVEIPWLNEQSGRVYHGLTQKPDVMAQATIVRTPFGFTLTTLPGLHHKPDDYYKSQTLYFAAYLFYQNYPDWALPLWSTEYFPRSGYPFNPEFTIPVGKIYPSVG